MYSPVIRDSIVDIVLSIELVQYYTTTIIRSNSRQSIQHDKYINTSRSNLTLRGSITFTLWTNRFRYIITVKNIYLGLLVCRVT